MANNMHSRLRYRWASALHRPSLWSPTVWVERCNVTQSCWFGMRQPCMKLITPICTEFQKNSLQIFYFFLKTFSLPCWKACNPLHTAVRCGGIFALQVISNVWIGLQRHLHPGAVFAHEHTSWTTHLFSFTLILVVLCASTCWQCLAGLWNRCFRQSSDCSVGSQRVSHDQWPYSRPIKPRPKDDWSQIVFVLSATVSFPLLSWCFLQH